MKRCLSCGSAYSASGWRCAECGYEPNERDGVKLFAPSLAERTTGFKPEYHKQLAELQDSNFWFQARNRLIVEVLRPYLTSDRRMLEIGCGTGCVLNAVGRAFPGAELCGSEVLLEGLSYALKRVPRASFFQMDARQIPFENDFDVVGAFDVLEHIEEDEAVMRQVHSSLKRHGCFIITVPQHQWLWSSQDEFACHVRRYSRADVIQKLTRSGFRVKEATSFVSLLLPAMMLSRFKKQKSEAFDGLNEIRLPGVLNRCFAGVMHVERFLMRSGIQLPVGGSLLVLAIKE